MDLRNYIIGDGLIGIKNSMLTSYTSEVIVKNNYRVSLSIEWETFGNVKAEASEAGA